MNGNEPREAHSNHLKAWHVEALTAESQVARLGVNEHKPLTFLVSADEIGDFLGIVVAQPYWIAGNRVCEIVGFDAQRFEPTFAGPLQRLFEGGREPPAARLGFRKPLRRRPRPARSPKTVIPVPPP